jgi:hypothetical protein
MVSSSRWARKKFLASLPLPAPTWDDQTRPLSDAERQFLDNVEAEPANVAALRTKIADGITQITEDDIIDIMASPAEAADSPTAEDIEAQLEAELDNVDNVINIADSPESDPSEEAEETSFPSMANLDGPTDDYDEDEDNIDDLEDLDDDLGQQAKAAMQDFDFPWPPITPASKKMAYCSQTKAVRRAILLTKDNDIFPSVMRFIAEIYRDLDGGKLALSQTKVVRKGRNDVNLALAAYKAGKE